MQRGPSASGAGPMAVKFPLSFQATGTKSPPMSTFSTANLNDSVEKNGLGIINPVFVDSSPPSSQSLVNVNTTDRVRQNSFDNHQQEVEVEEVFEQQQDLPFPPPPNFAIVQQTATKRPVETVDRTDSASSISNASTVITNASSTGGLIPVKSSNNRNSRQSQSTTTLTPDSICCPDCLHFHRNHHRFVNKNGQPLLNSGNYAATLPYAPYPPQWYYLLGADTKQFRKHRHTHYRRDCRQCREIVRLTFEQYYLRPGQQTNTMTKQPNQSDSTDSSSISLDHQNQAYLRANSPLSYYQSRASCGHSCLKFTILFYCCIAVIMSICFICYLTRMFGFMADPTPVSLSPADNEYHYQIMNDSIIYNNGSDYWHGTNQSQPILLQDGDEAPATTLLERIRAEMVGLLISSAFLIIFVLGLVGTFLESVLCLRIFGAILSYLFLLTFGSALYVVILLIISHVPLKLILSTISCSAVAITIHALLAIAPFAFADLINQQRNEDLIYEAAANSTYVKYPSVRFFPPPPKSSAIPNKRRSYFGLGTFGGGWSRPTIYPSGAMTSLLPGPTSTSSQQTFYRDTPIESIPTSPIDDHSNHHAQLLMDNISSEGLIPDQTKQQTAAKSREGSAQTVRFTDNWM